MESEQNDQREIPENPPYESRQEPQPAPPPGPQAAAQPSYQPWHPPARRTSGWRILWGILFGLSVLANVGLFFLLLGMVAFVATSGGGLGFEENVIRPGPRGTKIAVVNVAGIIDDTQAEAVYRQLRLARRDDAVQGLVVRVRSPGGTISASDRIYQAIRDYRREENEPAVAFMQGVAASGGYYVSVGCDEIIAEPTTITGSIGVIMAHFVFQDLLENKLGIQPVFLTVGEKKDWPSSFRAPSEEELAYIEERLLEPAYERFVDVIQEGRRKALSPSEVRNLADGGIYVADEAEAVQLIDRVGYIDEAVAMVKALAGIQDAQVVEYRTPFSFIELLGAQEGKANLLHLDRAKLFELSTPQVLYLWNAY